MATAAGISDSPNRPKLAVGYLTLRFTAHVFPSALFDLILEVLNSEMSSQSILMKSRADFRGSSRILAIETIRV